MKRTNFLLKLLLTLGLLAVLMPAAAMADGEGYRVYINYDESLCNFEVRDNTTDKPINSGDQLGVYNDAYYGTVSTIGFQVSDIAPGYRIQAIHLNNDVIPFSTLGYYGQGNVIIERDSTITLVLEPIPAELPGIERVDFMTLYHNMEPAIFVDSIQFEYGVYEWLLAQIITTDHKSYPDYYFDLEWEFSPDNENWSPLSSEKSLEFWAPNANEESDYEDGFFMTQQNYYLRLRVTGMPGHFTGDFYSAPIPVNHPSTSFDGYRVSVNYDLNHCLPVLFHGETNEQINNGQTVSATPGQPVYLGFWFDWIGEDVLVKEIRVNGSSCDPSTGEPYALSFQGDAPSEGVLDLEIYGNTVIDIICDTVYTDTGYTLDIEYDQTLCDLTVKDLSSSQLVSSGETVGIDPDFGSIAQVTVTNINPGYRIKSFTVNGAEYSLIEQASGVFKNNITLTQDTTFILELEEVPAQFPSTPELSPDFSDICDVDIEQNGNVLSVVVGQKEGAQEDISTFTSWVATYKDGRMDKLQLLTGTKNSNGSITFTGTVNGAGDKLFLLSGDMIPVINAAVSE